MSNCTTLLTVVAPSRATAPYGNCGEWAMATISGMANPRTHVDFAKATRRPQVASP